ncbi:hypothetical protein [Burkholderia sp. BCC1998]|uniref:hypothetical protein n=1 Tax=Burkholderia sp. BCC1998 TaxID=2817447 RepID=UPI002AB665D5|nr:hypothetical protein [Burkholderia sp. BCC1998]
MNEAFKSAGTGLPMWTSKEDKRGLDPLGMQTTSIALYQELLPGISNVTLRMRYYGFYAWLAQNYAERIGETSVERWCICLRRAEALYALIAAMANSERGVAGVIWASNKLAQTASGDLVFHPNTDRGSHPQYLKQKFGAFGAAYGSQLIEIGALEYVDAHQVPVPTADVGDQLAKLFNASVRDAAEVFWHAAHEGTVSRQELVKLAIMLPSRIEADSEECRLYQDLLFAKLHPKRPAALVRSQTLRLILRAAQANASGIDVAQVRWTLYAGRNSDGEAFDDVPSTEDERCFAWSVYHANDLLHLAYEAILRFVLDVLALTPAGLPLEHLVARVAERLTDALAHHEAGTWDVLLTNIRLATDPWSDSDALSEYRLHNDVLATGDSDETDGDAIAARAVLLLAVLHKRWEDRLERVRLCCPIVTEGEFVQSIVTELSDLRAHAHLPLSELLMRLVRCRIVERHLWVAIQKFRGQGDYTFLLECDDGRVRLRQGTGPVLTNPRLSSAITFLRDLHLLNDAGPTTAGLEVLAA